MVILSDQISSHLREAVQRLRAALHPQAIYLYGSHAYGAPNSKSDLDLLIVVPKTPLTAFERDAIAYRALGNIRFPIDVQVYTEDEFEARAALPLTFERTVKQKGMRVDAS